MKTMNLKTKIAVTALLLVSAFSYAAEFKQFVNVQAVETEKKAMISVLNPFEKKVSIKVENEGGTVVLFDKSYYDSKIAKILNFKELENGEYKVFIKSGKQIVEETFIISDGLVIIKSENIKLSSL